MEVRVRQAKPADRDQLARLREALWPEASADEHAREVEPILAGETPMVETLTIPEEHEQTKGIAIHHCRFLLCSRLGSDPRTGLQRSLEA